VTQQGSAVEVRFTEPGFMTARGTLSNRMLGVADASGLTLSTQGDDYSYFYYRQNAPSLIEIAADNSRLITLGSVVLQQTTNGFAGTMRGRLANYGPNYPADGYRGQCSNGQVTFIRQ
jgi:hypothetical protein